jgi:cytochrome b561
MAVVIFAAIAFGIVSTFLPPHTEPRMTLLALHKSLGVTALALVCLRVVLRIAFGAPAEDEPLAPLVRGAASIGHFALYALMFALPISGYLHSSAGRTGFSWFWLFPVPQIVGPDPTLNHDAGLVHYTLAWAIGAVLAAHLGAVVWHRFVKKDQVLARMWPGRARA